MDKEIGSEVISLGKKKGWRSFGSWMMAGVLFVLYIILAVLLGKFDFTLIGMVTVIGALLVGSFLGSVVVSVVTPIKEKVWQYWAIIFTSVVVTALAVMLLLAIFSALGVNIVAPTI